MELDYFAIPVKILDKIAKEKRLPMKPQLFDVTQNKKMELAIVVVFLYKKAIILWFCLLTVLCPIKGVMSGRH